jgi:hypothetical protein
MEFMTDLLKDWPWGTLTFIVISLCLLGVLYLVLLGFDLLIGYNESRSGIIVEKTYSSDSTATGVGPAIGSNSGGVAVTVSYTPEKYIVHVKLDDGGYDEVEVKKGYWYKCKRGDRFNYSVRKGRFTGVEL